MEAKFCNMLYKDELQRLVRRTARFSPCYCEIGTDGRPGSKVSGDLHPSFPLPGKPGALPMQAGCGVSHTRPRTLELDDPQNDTGQKKDTAPDSPSHLDATASASMFMSL